jgi:steroid delta-isomerase-like uncharacterized protein
MPKLSVSVQLAAAVVFLAACGGSSAEQTASGDSATAAAGTQPANASTNASAAANEAVVRRFNEAQNREDWAAVDSLLAPGFVHHGGGKDQDSAAWKAGALDFAKAFKAQATLEDVVAAGDRVAVRWTGRATHRGTYAGIPATGRELTGRGAMFYRVVDGRIAESWEVFDTNDFRQQLLDAAGSTGR